MKNKSFRKRITAASLALTMIITSSYLEPDFVFAASAKKSITISKDDVSTGKDGVKAIRLV